MYTSSILDDAEYFELGDKDKTIDAIKEKYKQQCPAIYNQGLSSDSGMLYLLAVTAKHKNDYILHLIDDYSRHRVRNMDNKAYASFDFYSEISVLSFSKIVLTFRDDFLLK